MQNPALDFTVQERYVVDLNNKRKDLDIKRLKKKVQVVSKQIGDDVVKIGFVMAHDHQSDLGNEIVRDPVLDCDIAVLVGPVGVSLRANPSCPINVGKIAALNGGGGHKAASGVKLANILGQDLLDIVVKNLKLEP